ncbi:hypothetical protein M3Y99_01627900 [Aphelenchoides fujianensis]|nr:hypothetical protein M3Y99_01627900 [Aphelenchoides fujianensis]
MGRTAAYTIRTPTPATCRRPPSTGPPIRCRPGAFMQHPNGQLGAGDGSEYSNGLTEYYPESYVQPCSSPAAFNSHPSPVFPQQAGPSTSAEPTATSPRIVNFASNSPSLPPSSIVKQQLQQHIHQQRPKLHNMYGHSPAVFVQQQQQPMGQHSISATHSPSAHSPATPSFHPHPANPASIDDRRHESADEQRPLERPLDRFDGPAERTPDPLRAPLFAPAPIARGRLVRTGRISSRWHRCAHSTDGMPANSTAKMPAVSTSTPSTAAASISSTMTSGDSAEKPKPPKPKRVRKTAAQLKAERAEKAAAEAARLAAASQPPPNASSAPKDIVITRPLAPNTSGDSSHLLMPPPKVAQAPSVLAAAAKAANSSAVHPQQQPASTSQTAAIPAPPYP